METYRLTHILSLLLIISLFSIYSGCKPKELETILPLIMNSGGGTPSGTDSDTTSPADAGNLLVTPGDGQAVLTWDDPSDGDFDHVEITWSPGGTAIISVASGAGTYTATGLTNGVSYTFTVKTVDQSGNATAGITSGSVTPVIGRLPKKTGQTQCYETNNGWTTAQAASDCNTPTGGYTLPEGQDGKLQIGTTPSYTGPTLVGASDYITKDSVTGLIWKTCSEGYDGADCSNDNADPNTYTWNDAFIACEALNSVNAGAGYAARTNWRLPTVDELDNIVERSTSSPAVNTSHFPATVAYAYWSSSTYVPNTTLAWVVDFSNGYVTYGSKSSNNYVRCVSTGP